MNKKLITLAKKLRSDSTEVEKKLWHHLRGNRFEGMKWRRQQVLGKYIVDFVCLEKKIFVECDGGHHVEQAAEDKERDVWLFGEGFRVLCFWNNLITEELQTVLEVIFEACGGFHPLPSPPPSRGRE